MLMKSTIGQIEMSKDQGKLIKVNNNAKIGKRYRGNPISR